MNKSRKKEKKWKRLRHNQFAGLWLLVFLWILCLLAGYLSYMITKDGYVLKKMVAMLVIGVSCITTICLITHKTRKISRLMKHFIRKNKLYQSHFVKQEGTKEMIEKIDYYPCVAYREEKAKNIFSIRIRLDGSMLAEKFRDMEQALADILYHLRRKD